MTTDVQAAPAMAYPSLKAMAEDKENDTVSKITSFAVDPMILEVEPGFNLRIEGPDLDAHIAEMKAAIRAGAVMPPIDVRVDKGRTIVVEGHCRRRSYRELIAEGFPVGKIEARHFRGNDAARIFHMLGTSKGKALKPLEQGIGYERASALGFTNEQIALRDGGKSITHVENGLLLGRANIDVQRLISDGKVSVELALTVIRKNKEDAGKVLADLLARLGGTGKTLTVKAINGRSLPRKLITRFTSSVSDLFSSLPEETMQKIESADSDDDAMVSVSARTMKALLSAHAEAAKIKGAPADVCS